MEKQSDQTGSESKARLVEQVNICLRAGDYARALDLLRSAAAEFSNDTNLAELEKLAHDGVKRNSEANRLITESQELFAQRKSSEALQLLRQAYELDQRNSLARAILANALVEHAQSVVETDWLEAETLTNQALKLNPAHPTAKTIHSLIVEQKKTSSVEDWVARARKLQSSGDLFAALAWVAEGLAVHPDDPKLLQIHESIQRDQGARRRQARRGDVEELRRMELAIDEAPDPAAKQALAERIQAMAAKYWTDGEILSIANRLLHRLGLATQEGESASSNSKGAAVIFHVPRTSVPETSREELRESPPSPSPSTSVAPSPAPPQDVPAAASGVSSGTVPASKVPPSDVVPRQAPPRITPPSLDLTPSTEAVISAHAEPSEPPAGITSPPSRPKQAEGSRSLTMLFIVAAAMILVAATFFFTRRHYAPAVTNHQSAGAATAPAQDASSPEPAASTSAVAAPATPAPAGPSEPGPEPSSPAVHTSSDAPAEGATLSEPPKDIQPLPGSGHSLGALLVVTGEDGAKVFLDGKLQSQLTQAGQLRLPNLEFKDYVVQISKSGFQDPPQQTVRIRKGEPARVIFHLQPQNPQPQPRLASLAIQGGAPGTTVLVDQALVGTIQPDGTLAVSTVSPGDHTVELRKERFTSRQFKKHFVAGDTVSLAPADATLQGAPSSVTIAFAPPDATVALVKGEALKIVSSGVPLDLSPGTYTLTARTAEKFTRTGTLEVIAGQPKTLNLSLAPSGMSKWDNPGAWKQEKESFIRKGGDFVLYGAVPAAGTFVFSAMPIKGHLLQWVVNYIDSRNYVLFQMDENNFYRTVIHNGEKTGEIKIPDKGDKKSFRTLQIRVSSTELVHQIKHGEHSTVLDRWTPPATNLTLGKFGFYLPGDDQIAVSNFAYYPDLNLR